MPTVSGTRLRLRCVFRGGVQSSSWVDVGDSSAAAFPDAVDSSTSCAELPLLCTGSCANAVDGSARFTVSCVEDGTGCLLLVLLLSVLYGKTSPSVAEEEVRICSRTCTNILQPIMCENRKEQGQTYDKKPTVATRETCDPAGKRYSFPIDKPWNRQLVQQDSSKMRCRSLNSKHVEIRPCLRSSRHERKMSKQKPTTTSRLVCIKCNLPSQVRERCITRMPNADKAKIIGIQVKDPICTNCLLLAGQKLQFHHGFMSARFAELEFAVLDFLRADMAAGRPLPASPSELFARLLAQDGTSTSTTENVTSLPPHPSMSASSSTASLLDTTTTTMATSASTSSTGGLSLVSIPVNLQPFARPTTAMAENKYGCLAFVMRSNGLCWCRTPSITLSSTVTHFDAGSSTPHELSFSYGDRVETACSFCHTYRVKCDRERPCPHCRQLGIVCQDWKPRPSGRPRAQVTLDVAPMDESTDAKTTVATTTHLDGDTRPPRKIKPDPRWIEASQIYANHRCKQHLQELEMLERSRLPPPQSRRLYTLSDGLARFFPLEFGTPAFAELVRQVRVVYGPVHKSWAKDVGFWRRKLARILDSPRAGKEFVAVERFTIPETDPRVALRGQSGVRLLQDAEQDQLVQFYGGRLMTLAETSELGALLRLEYTTYAMSYASPIDGREIACSAMKDTGNITRFINDYHRNPYDFSRSQEDEDKEREERENVLLGEIVINDRYPMVFVRIKKKWLAKGTELLMDFGPGFWTEVMQQTAQQNALIRDFQQSYAIEQIVVE